MSMFTLSITQGSMAQSSMAPGLAKPNPVSLTLAQFFAPLQSMVTWLAGGPLPKTHAQAPHPHKLRSLDPVRAPSAMAGLRNAHSLSGDIPRKLANKALGRPLRVSRVLEANQPSFTVGRMVMSGRMADVCAELDRLVAIEEATRRVLH